MVSRRSQIPVALEEESDEALAALLAQPPSHQSPNRPTLERLPGGRLEGAAIEEGRVHLLAAADTIRLLADWRSFLATTLSDKSVADYWRAAFAFFRACPVPLDEVSESHLTAYLERFPHRSSARKTYYYALKHLFAWAHRKGHVPVDPTVAVTVAPPMEKEPVALSPDEVARIAYTAALRHPIRGLAALLLYYTGCRIGEATTLEWSDIHGNELVIQGHKSGRERRIVIGTRLAGTLEGLRHYGSSERILPRTPMTVWEWLREAGRAAGIERVHPHLFRATTATVMLNRLSEAGVPPDVTVVVVKKWLGHRKLETTLRYVAVADTALAQAGDLL